MSVVYQPPSEYLQQSPGYQQPPPGYQQQPPGYQQQPPGYQQQPPGYQQSIYITPASSQTLIVTSQQPVPSFVVGSVPAFGKFPVTLNWFKFINYFFTNLINYWLYSKLIHLN
jgi:hypothetical protein